MNDKVNERKNVCVFCLNPEGHICSSCTQKILLMNEAALNRACLLASEKGDEEQAEILESYREEIYGYDGIETVARRSLRERRVRSVRHEKNATGQAEAQ